MAFGFAGASAGASDALQQMLEQQRAAFLEQERLRMAQAAQEQQAAQFNQRLGIDRDELGVRQKQMAADNADRASQRERQTRLDTQAESDRNLTRSRENASAGVRRMIGDFLVQRGAQPLDPQSRQTLQGMALQENVDLPANVVSDPEAPHRRTVDLEGVRHRHNLAEIAAQGAESRQTNSQKPTAAGRGVLSGDANRIAELRTSLDDLRTLRTTIAAPGESGATGTRAKIGAMVPNVVTEVTGFGMDAKKKQAVINRVKQVIGKALEGGVLRKEDELKYEKILPTIGDPDEVVLTKLAGLDTAITQRLEQQIEALEQAGYNVSGFRGGKAATGGATNDADALLDELLGGGR